MIPRIHLLAGAVVLFGTLTSSGLALDLHPRFHTSVFDGMVVRRPYFSDGDKKFGVITDGETEVGASGDGAVFRFRTINMASVTLTPSPLSAAMPLEDGTLERFRTAAMGLLPPAAEQVVLEAETPDALPVNGWRSHRFVFTFRHGANSMRESVTFLNLDAKQQIVIRTAARLPEWGEVASRADDIMVRWHEIRPDEKAEN